MVLNMRQMKLKEMIDKEIIEIEQELGWFLKKYNLKIEKISEYGFIYKSKYLKLNFIYGRFSNYSSICFENLKIYDGIDYDFKDVIKLMQKERKEEAFDIRKKLVNWEDYNQYFKSHFVPFLEMDNHKEIMSAYIESLNLPY